MTREFNRSKKQVQFLFTVLVVISMLFPANSFAVAQDETPPADTPPTEVELVEPITIEQATVEIPLPAETAEPIELVQPTVEIPVEETSVPAVPASTDIPLVEQTVVVPPELSSMQPIVPVTGEEETVTPELKVADAVKVLAQTDSNLVNSLGEVIPLVSQEAAEILADGDPIIERGGITYRFLTSCTGFENCFQSPTPVSAAVAFAENGETIKIAAGTYNEDVLIDKDIILKGVQTESSNTVGDVLISTVRLFSNISNWTNIFVTNVFVNSGAQIQDGIDIANSGGTVNVASGTYTINSTLTIEKPLTLRGLPGTDSAGAASDAPIIQPNTPAAFNTTTHTTTDFTPETGLTIQSDNVKVNGFIIKGFNIGVKVLPKTNGTKTSGLEINNNTLLNNIKYDIQLTTDATNPLINYNAFLDDIHPNSGKFLPVGYALYKPNNTSQIYAEGNYWGYDRISGNDYYGPVGYLETGFIGNFAGIISQQLHNDSKLDSELGNNKNEIPTGFTGTYRQGIVNGYPGNNDPATIKVKFNGDIATTYTISPQCTGGKIWNGQSQSCVTQVVCGANQISNGAGGCACADGYVDGPQTGLQCVTVQTSCKLTEEPDGNGGCKTKTCNDGDPRTDDTLNSDGTCSYVLKTCNDGDPRTDDTLNSDGTCSYVLKTCNDGDPRTNDTLNSDGTCSYVLNLR